MRGVKRVANYEVFNEWSPEMAYLLGFAFAEGHLTLLPRHALIYAFGSKSDLPAVICSLMGSVTRGTTVKSKLGDSIQIRYSDVHMCQRLMALGLPRGKKGINLRYPYIPASHSCHFVRGYFDGDGSAHMNPNARSKMVSFFSISLPFLEGLQEWFGLRGCKGSLYTSPRKSPRHDLHQLWFARAQCRRRIYRLLYCDVPEGQYSPSKKVKFLEVAQLQRIAEHPAFWDAMRRELGGKNDNCDL